jgi:cytochrome c oxidase assembly factor CtaG
MTPEKMRLTSLSFFLLFILFILLIAAWFVLGIVAEEGKKKYPWMANLTWALGLIGLLVMTGCGIYLRVGPERIARLIESFR